MKQYTYSGPVWIFNNLVANKFQATTVAPSREKALSNLKYQFKMLNNYVASARVTLDPKYLT